MSQADTKTESESTELPEPTPQFKGGDDELKTAAQALADRFDSIWDDNDTTVTDIRRGTETFDADLNVKLDTTIASSTAAARALEDTPFEFQNMLKHASGTVEISADYVDDAGEDDE